MDISTCVFYKISCFQFFTASFHSLLSILASPFRTDSAGRAHFELILFFNFACSKGGDFNESKKLLNNGKHAPFFLAGMLN
jgi:hypothetical protein